MTDPEWADATYLEPLDAPTLAEIVARESPDALLPTLGGQTALNLAVELAEAGVLAEHGVELIGADVDAIRRAEDRLAVPGGDGSAGLPVPRSVVVDVLEQLNGCPVPAVVRPAFTLGGRGGGIARTHEELRAARRARPGREPDRPGAGRAVARGLAGVRARGDGRLGRQLRRRLLDREPRPDGRPHRRLVDGRAAADASGRRVPAAARRRVHVRARRRRRDRAARTCSSPTSRRARELARDRDEPARVALVGARVEGDGLPDREARRAARGRLHARRAAERHHRQTTRRVRAGARLRRGEGAALRLREVPGTDAGSAPRCARSARRSASGGRSRRRS